MSGQGPKRVAECLRKRGRAFQERPLLRYGLPWCRHCGYQTKIHYDAIRATFRLVKS